jgi:hypothetical protein
MILAKSCLFDDFYESVLVFDQLPNTRQVNSYDLVLAVSSGVVVILQVLDIAVDHSWVSC